MASLYITEHYVPPMDNGNLIPAVTMPPIAEQKETIGGASVQSDAFNSLTRLVALHADAACSVAFGADPTATAANRRIAGSITEFFTVTPGHKVAVITND